ncbi:MAG: ribonuclease J [Patescibacteria group bacterium]|nr:ribonuclease J [Patescibacteria group bacterium]
MSKKKSQTSSQIPQMKSPGGDGLKIIPLGGVGQMGKNLVAVEYQNDILIIDCGFMFPDESMLGIDYVIPDTTYLEQNKSRVRAIVVTHGHEDHIGAVPYIAPKLNVPVYAPVLAAALIEINLEEFALKNQVKVIKYKPQDKIRVGKAFTVSFFRVTHSIPDAFGLIVETPEGIILHTGDFKFDPTPPDGIGADYDKLKQIGDKKPLLLMSESTNAHTPGRTVSEQVIADTFMDIFASTKGRLIVSSFASRIDRMQHVLSAAAKYKRKVAIAGRSMVKYFDVAVKLGYLKVPKGLLVPLHQIKRIKDHQLVILSTGSQGQEGSALQRMAFKEHRQVQIKEGDTVVVSSSPIPGNERSISAVINNLYRAGAHVIFDKKMQIHVTGHAYQEEMKQMLELVRPRYFIPVHGEYHMLVAHKELAESVGIPPKNIFVIEDGDVVEFKNGKAKKLKDRIHAGSVLIDGLGVGDVKEVVLRDRQTMAKEGTFVVITVVDKRGRLVGTPDIMSRGFVYVKEKGALMDMAKQRVQNLFKKHVKEIPDDWTNIKSKLREQLSEFLFQETGRRPLVLPVVIEV